MSLRTRALLPALALSGVLMSLSPVASADPPHRAYSYASGHSYYSPVRDYRDRRAPRVYYYESRNDYGRNYNDYRYRQPTYRYQGSRSYSGYGGYSGNGSYGGYSSGYGSYGGNYGGYPVERRGGCSSSGPLALLGAVTGGIIGHRSGSYQHRDINTVAGALAGGIVGGAIGSSIDGGCRGY